MFESEELLDENKRLCDVRPFAAVLKIIERIGDKAEKTLNVLISHLIGKGEPSYINLFGVYSVDTSTLKHIINIKSSDINFKSYSVLIVAIFYLWC